MIFNEKNISSFVVVLNLFSFSLSVLGSIIILSILESTKRSLKKDSKEFAILFVDSE